MTDTMKKCAHCQKEKVAAEFTPDKKMLSGLASWCNPCRRTAEKLRGDRHGYYTERNKTGAHLDYLKKWRANNKEKRDCHNAFHRALQKGLISKKPCSVCNSDDSQAHHDDYTNPLDVTWFCRSHHHQLHSNQNRQAQPMKVRLECATRRE